MNKSILKSKTFWVQVAALAAALFPAVQKWLAENPVEFVAVLTAINVIVRFVTSGSITILGAGDDDDFWNKDSANGWMPFLVVSGFGAAVLGTVPSCSPAQIDALRAVPVKVCAVTHDGTVCYSSDEGLAVEIDRTSGK